MEDETFELNPIGTRARLNTALAEIVLLETKIEIARKAFELLLDGQFGNGRMRLIRETLKRLDGNLGDS